MKSILTYVAYNMYRSKLSKNKNQDYLHNANLLPKPKAYYFADSIINHY